MTGEPRYLRVQAGYRGRLRVEVGVFVAVDHLRRAGRLTDAETALYLDIDDWFQEHLPNPGFYADGNTIGAVTWFKDPVPNEMGTRVGELRAILSAHGVPHEVARSADPGTVIYRDEFQVGVVPYVRGEQDPLPVGGPLRPTTAGSKRAVEASRVGHVLLDADGVMQRIPGGWYAAMEPYLGDRAREFLHKTWKDERPMLAGQGDYLPVLAAALSEYGVAVPVQDVYADVWHRIEVSAESVAVVRALRRNGYGVHLATNQERYRAAYLRDVLGYDALFDVSCYSCELGLAKPAPAFFAEAVRRIGAEPPAVLFIDDSAGNVEGARAAGLAAGQWSLEQGHDALARLLARHGVAALPGLAPLPGAPNTTFRERSATF